MEAKKVNMRWWMKALSKKIDCPYQGDYYMIEWEKIINKK